MPLCTLREMLQVATRRYERENPNSPDCCNNGLEHCGAADSVRSGYGVVINPLLVATIQRLPQRTIDSIRPNAGTVFPAATLKTPLGPSSTAVPPATSRTVQPSIVIGFVSGTGASLGTSGSSARTSTEAVCCGATGERLIDDEAFAGTAATDRLRAPDGGVESFWRSCGSAGP